MSESSNNAQEEIDQLLYKYYAYQLTETEERRLEEYCRQRPGLRNIMRRLDDKDLVRRDISQMEKLQVKKPTFTKGRFVRWGIGLAAASILAIIWTFPPRDNKAETHAISMSSDAHLIRYNTLTTPKGGQYKVTLPDGSNVWLNNASSLRYPTVFAGGTRDVYLSGEAYFEIAENMRQPFMVHYEGRPITTHVLGTSFDIRAYPGDASSKITLLTGKVQVTGEHRSIVIKPNQQLVIPAEGDWLQPKDINPQDITAWREGMLHFDGDDPLQAFQDIERCYGRKIVTSGKLHTVQIIGSFKRSLPLLTLLETLSQDGKNFHYTPKDDTIFISR